MDGSDSIPENYIEIADKVRSGEYFREAREIADFDLHNPMAERYWYIFLTAFSVIIAFIAFNAWQGLYPLRPSVPFIVTADNIVDDSHSLQKLVAFHGEDANVALRRFLVRHYVKIREEYNADSFDREHDAVGMLSSERVFDEYENFVLPLNPASPIALYQRHTIRTIEILYSSPVVNPNFDSDGKYYMRVIFNTFLEKDGVKKAGRRYQVDVAFKYKDIKLDQETGKIEPYGFLVTSYDMKGL
ncbi:MAG: VirB8/TrbF family protein [Rickettsiales bacterium]